LTHVGPETTLVFCMSRLTAARRHAAIAVITFMMLTVAAEIVSAETRLYRVFLTDGSTLVSFGEFARVADRVIVSIPVGAGAGSPNLQPVSISESEVDWEKTDRYTDAVRARRYGETRGEEDFALLGGRVVEAINQLALTADPSRRLAMAEEARRNLMKWSADNYGYRAADIVQLSTLFDEVISDLRIAAGKSGFEVSLVATTLPPPHVDLLPDPSARETLEQAFTAARLTPEPSERMSLLTAITAALREPGERTGWAAALAARATSALASELRIEQSYKDLASSTIAAATRTAERADVRGLQAIVQRVLATDERLGRQRPQQTAALLALLDLRLDDARRLRLARDAWALRLPLFEAYRRNIAPAVDYLRSSKAWLDDIRDLAGPTMSGLNRLEQRVTMGRRALERVDVPAELASVQSLLGAAFQMAMRAAAGRRAAISSNNMTLAWEASSAAAGALLMLDRAATELDRLTTSLQHR
jgi:hypothetical protein